MQRYLIILITSILLASNSYCKAQNLSVEGMSHVVNDLTCKMNQRLDLNNVPCALLKIQFLGEILKIEGNVIGDIHYEGTELWVYVTHTTKTILIKAKNHKQLLINFADYNIDKLLPKSTYLLMLQSDLPLDKLIPQSNVTFAPMMSKKDDIIPTWLPAISGQGYWIGISHPTINRIEARQMAIVNLLLHYCISNGGGKCTMVFNSDEEIDDGVQTVNFNYADEIVLDSIDLEIINEYYNHYGEYFVAGNISTSTKAKDRIRILRTAVVKNSTAEYEYTCQVSCKYGRCDVHVKKTFEKNVCTDLKYSINNKEISFENLDYVRKGMMFASKSKDITLLAKNNQSCGIAMFDLFSNYTVLCDSFKVNSFRSQILSNIDGRLNDKIEILKSCQSLGNRKTFPSGVKLYQYDNEMLRYRRSGEIKDYASDMINTTSGRMPYPLYISDIMSLTDGFIFIVQEQGTAVQSYVSRGSDGSLMENFMVNKNESNFKIKGHHIVRLVEYNKKIYEGTAVEVVCNGEKKVVVVNMSEVMDYK